jgi:hypothetical protein
MKQHVFRLKLVNSIQSDLHDHVGNEVDFIELLLQFFYNFQCENYSKKLFSTSEDTKNRNFVWRMDLNGVVVSNADC